MMLGVGPSAWSQEEMFNCIFRSGNLAFYVSPVSPSKVYNIPVPHFVLKRSPNSFLRESHEIWKMRSGIWCLGDHTFHAICILLQITPDLENDILELRFVQWCSCDEVPEWSSVKRVLSKTNRQLILSSGTPAYRMRPGHYMLDFGFCQKCLGFGK